MTNSQSLIKTTNLTKLYKLSEDVTVQALVDVSIQIKEGEYVAILGPSGCGKSTLLNLIGCLDTPTKGKYWLDNKEIKKTVNLAAIRNQQIGFVFQTFNLLPRLTAVQNVELPLVYKGTTPEERRTRAEFLLKDLGLGNRLEHKPTQLSGGQQQRVAVARALANDPKIILADEPTGNLDSGSGNEVMDILRKLNNNGRTVIVVTHDPILAQEAERKIKMLDGRVV